MAIIYKSIHEIMVLVGSSLNAGSDEPAQKHSLALTTVPVPFPVVGDQFPLILKVFFVSEQTSKSSCDISMSILTGGKLLYHCQYL